MRGGIRWRVLLPVALLLTVAAPALRALPGGSQLPDPWLLLALTAVPARASERLRHAIQVVVVLGLLRAAVSAVSPWTAIAGLATALFVRERLHRHISEESVLWRFLVGALTALAPTLLDQREAALLGLDRPWSAALLAVVWVGVFWALVMRPGPRRWRLQR